MSERELTNKQEVDWVELQCRKWDETYDIPINKEFFLREFFKAQQQFFNTPQEHTKAKLDLLRMIKELDVSDNLKERNVGREHIHIYSESISENEILVKVYQPYKIICHVFENDVKKIAKEIRSKFPSNIIHIEPTHFGNELYNYFKETDKIGFGARILDEFNWYQSE